MSWAVGTPVLVDPPWGSGGAELGTATPVELDTAAAGASTFAAHEDHIHPATIGAIAIALINDARFTDQRVPTDLSVTNGKVAAGAAIAYSKLNLAGAILNADLAGGIAYSKLSLAGAILDADLAGSISPSKIAGTAVITSDSRLSDTRSPTAGSVVDASVSATAEIAVSKLADGAANDVLVTNADGVMVNWQSGLINAHIGAAAAIDVSKLAVGTSNQLLRVISGVATWSTITDSSISSTAEIQVSKLADGAANDVLVTDTDGTTVVWKTGLLNAHIASGAAILISKIDATQEAWTAVSFASGWVNYSGLFQSVAYMKDSFGFVHLKGLAARTSGSSTVIFTLPSGYRPPLKALYGVHSFNSSAFALGRVDIATDGTVNMVIPSTITTDGYIQLEGLCFKV